MGKDEGKLTGSAKHRMAKNEFYQKWTRLHSLTMDGAAKAREEEKKDK